MDRDQTAALEAEVEAEAVGGAELGENVTPAAAGTGMEKAETSALGKAPHEQPSKDDAPTTTATTTAHPSQPAAISSPPAPNPLTLSLSLMLTTGVRHPYTLDERYLRSRHLSPTNASTGAIDPRELSGYQLKELIWTDWRSEWEPKPANPSSIRLILLGRMVEDKMGLKDLPFKIEPGAVNVVHMTVRPADLDGDDDAGGAGKAPLHSHRRSRAGREEDGGEERGAGCRCVVQ